MAEPRVVAARAKDRDVSSPDEASRLSDPTIAVSTAVAVVLGIANLRLDHAACAELRAIHDHEWPARHVDGRRPGAFGTDMCPPALVHAGKRFTSPEDS